MIGEPQLKNYVIAAAILLSTAGYLVANRYETIPIVWPSGVQFYGIRNRWSGEVTVCRPKKRTDLISSETLAAGVKKAKEEGFTEEEINQELGSAYVVRCSEIIDARTDR
jgi:hypothetical protein